MEFPVWHFVGIGSGLIIGIVSVLHVFVAQFAVGGGIYLVWMERKAHRDGAPEILQWLERHTHFFLLLTMVFGGLSGVGIWFTMSVVNPGATSMLIHNFVFFWAAEWGLFLLEVVSLLAYYSTYAWSRNGRMSPEAHMRIGIVYACAGFLSLVLINGIITFMLTPGQGLSTGNVWLGFFNPTYWPSVVVRLGICLILAGMFALFTAPRIASAEARRIAVRVSGLWIILPFFLLLGGSVWYFMVLPPDRQEAILNRTSDIHSFLITYGWMLPAVFLAGVVAFVRAERLRKPLGIVILCSGLLLVGSFEWVRETARRPWVAESYMYSNGMSVVQDARAKAGGIASVSGWVRTLDAVESGSLKLEAPLADGLGKGSMLFALQCNVCHGLGGPRIDIIPRVRRLTRYGLEAQLQGQGTRLGYMPPFAGSFEDRRALADYLQRMGAQRKTFPSPEEQ